MTMSFWDDMLSGPALSGALSGAATGGMMSGGSPWGALIGGGIGLAGGAYMDSKRDAANDRAKQTQMQILQNIRAMNRGNYKQHIDDINKALSFYSVPQDYWTKLYGSGGGAQPLNTGSWTTGVK